MARRSDKESPVISDTRMLTRKNSLPPFESITDQGHNPHPDPYSDPEPHLDPPREPEPNILELLRRLLDDLTSWLALEGDLARSEVAEKSRVALRGLMIGASGVVLFVCGGIAILLAIGFGVSGALERVGVDSAFSHALGFFISGLVGAFIGWLAIDKAKTTLSPARLLPSRTTAALHRALRWAGATLHLHPPDENEKHPPSQ